MIKCLIVDDEVIAQQVLVQYILQTDGLTLLAKSRNALEAFARLEEYEIDLIFLDIEMPLVNGIRFLESLPNPPKIIFTTAYAEYALKGYELNVVDYLLKLFSYERFRQAVEKVKVQVNATKVEESISDSNDFLLVKEREGLIRIPHAEIFYIEGSRDYMKIVTYEKQYLVHMTMKKLEEVLPTTLFMRTHKSYIVSIRQIKALKNDELLLNNQQIIPVSANYKEQVTGRFSRR